MSRYIIQRFLDLCDRCSRTCLCLIFAEWQGEVSMQESVLLHEHHTVLVGMTLCACYQAA